MGEHDVDEDLSDEQLRAFMTALLDDMRALEEMLEKGMIETGARRIGAEQEMFLVNPGMRPAALAMKALDVIDHPAFVTELARYNLEANLEPYEFRGDCLSRMETDLRTLLEAALVKLDEKLDAALLLTGILPTLNLADLSLENMTPNPRYFALNRAVMKQRGSDMETRLKGIDDLYVTHDNVMLESCNTSFQLHYQVEPGEFRNLYNLSQAISAPLLAAAVNSPLLLGKRLWHETRVALFEQSVDSRSDVQKVRGGRSRVSFGEHWVNKSIIELHREDIARFRILIATDVGEPSTEMVKRGEAPPLTALRLHNGTVYRWNRPCYGVADGVAHIRIENRILPAGPTVIDEMANTAFFFGLMAAGPGEWGDVTERMQFADAKSNFVTAARLGLKAQFTWMDGRRVPATELVLELIPLARKGLVDAGVDAGDADRYLGVLQARVESGRTGAQWVLDSLAEMGPTGTTDQRMRALTAATHERQKTSQPVHTWELARPEEVKDWRPSYETVGQFMTTDLFTVRPEDVVDLAASLMEWERIRHIPVEDNEGHLVGLVTHRTLIRLLVQGYGKQRDDGPVAVRDIMKTDPVTVTPETPTIAAIRLMREQKVGSLPVLSKGKLVGIITERDLIDVSAQLLEEHLRAAFGPVATKLAARTAEEVSAKKLTIVGVESILKGDNTMVIQSKLEAFLSPQQREALAAEK